MPRTKPAFHVEGVDDLRRELRQAGDKWPRELGKAHKRAADVVAVEARARALREGGVQAKAAPAIKSVAAQRHAAITVTASTRFPFALGAFLGAKAYRQFPEWVGAAWQPGGPGGAIAVNPAIRDKANEFMDVYEAAVDELLRRAFPN